MAKIESIKTIAYLEDGTETYLQAPMDSLTPDEQVSLAGSVMNSLLAEQGLMPFQYTEKEGIIMPTSLQLAGDEGSTRLEAIQALQGVADKYGLSYTIEQDTITLTLPKHDDQELPVVGHVDVDDIEAPDSVGGD